MMEDLLNEDLVDTPDDIERVIEGGEDRERINNSGHESGSEDGRKENENKENENDDKEKVKIKRKMGPRPIVNAERLKGPRGLAVMETFFSDVRLRGKGHEREDLDLVMGRLEHWTHRLCPKMQFDDSLKRIEKLGSRKDVSNLVKRIRLGMVDDEGVEGPVVDPPDSPPPRAPSPDAFDQLLSNHSAPAAATASSEITEEQRERMLRNRLIAEERRAARIQKARELQERFKNAQSQSVAEGPSAQVENQRGVENIEREPMDIDEDGLNEIANVGNINEPGENINHFGNQPDLIGNGNEVAALENDMDVDEMQPDILASGNHVQPDLLRAANQNANEDPENAINLGARGNQPDVLGAGNAGDDAPERIQNQPDILARRSNPPDILAGRSEPPPDLVERNSNPPDLLN